jgi:hypothetical protein
MLRLDLCLFFASLLAAGAAQLRSVIFSTYVTNPAVKAAFREALGKNPA